MTSHEVELTRAMQAFATAPTTQAARNRKKVATTTTTTTLATRNHNTSKYPASPPTKPAQPPLPRPLLSVHFLWHQRHQLSHVRVNITLDMTRHYRRHQWRAEIIFAADLFPSICGISLAILQYFGRRAACECRGHSSPHTSLLMLLLCWSLDRREWNKLNQWRHLRSNNRSFSDRNWVKLKSTFLINRINIGWFYMLYL